ncbi:MAG: DUF3106 domain-containing protein [Pseudomonadota bacterium]
MFCAAVLALAAASASAQTLPAPTPVSPTPAIALKPGPVPATGKPLWKDLTRPQQVALEPLMPEWDRMESVRKQKWLDIANRYASKTPDEQLRIQERMRAWMKLTPEERRVARENYTLSKKIDKSQKSAQWEQYQQLPEEQKKKLAADAAVKKQVTNLPPKTQPKAVAPIKPNPAVVCAAGTVKNANPAGPACIPVPVAAPVTVPPASIPAPGNPAIPVPNAKQ